MPSAAEQATEGSVEQVDAASVALRCSGISKRFDAVVALNALTFTAHAGEVHAILGENGAGKSTFVKILGGTHQADDGRLEVFGEEVATRSPRAAQGVGIWVAYQELSLASALTVAQSIWLTSLRSNRLGMFPRAEAHRRTLRLLEEWEAPMLDPDEKVANLPVAQRQVVEILRCLAHSPRVVVFDEATAALPASETEWALGVARKLAAKGSLVLFISHRIGEIRRVAHRVTIFRNGEAVRSGATADLSDDDMIKAMLGRNPEALYPPPLKAPREREALTVRDLHVDRRLHGVDFALREGEILGVGGLQGQGQSHLLFALYGMIRSSGDVEVYGKKRKIRSPKDALAAGIALVPEDRRLEGLLMTKTIRENVALPNLRRVSHGGFLSPGGELDFARERIAALNVRASSTEQGVATLSGGNQQKVVVAKLLALQTPVLLLDDFTRGIDVGTKADLFQLLRELTADGNSILFHSSDAQELVEMCDRVLVLRGGTVSALLSGDDLSEEQVMRAAFGLGGRES